MIKESSAASRQDWRGVFAVLCTPFHADGTLDLPSLAAEIEFCLRAGVKGLVGLVNASESWTLSDEERFVIADTTVKEVAGQVPVIIGVSAGSREVSTLYARHAQEIGADAVMAMPPPSRMGVPVDIPGFYQALSDSIDLTIFVQNHDAPLGTRMAPTAVSALVENIPNVCWIKEETLPPGPAIAEELRRGGDKLRGVMGGQAGRYIFDEHRRGSCGTMPACESSDVHALIWDLLDSGDEKQARQHFSMLLPLLNYEALSPGVYKTVLQWRGVIETDYLRSVGGNPLDREDRLELREILSGLADLFVTSPPQPDR